MDYMILVLAWPSLVLESQVLMSCSLFPLEAKLTLM